MAQPQLAKADDTTVSVDNARTGWDKNEPGLSPADVSDPTFGQIFSTTVDGQVFAQPLVAGGMLIVTTDNNKVYGLDPQSGTILWTRSDLGPAWPASSIDPPNGCGDLGPTIGITAAPVYDPAGNTVYFTSKTYANGDPTQAIWLMHAIDPGTGTERSGWPTKIQGSPSNDPATPFDAFHEMQRPGLLLMGGVVYAAFGAHCDFTPWHGYVVGVDATTGHQTAMWTSETNDAGSGAGIWQSGGGLVSDGDGRILLATGNGISPKAGPGTSPGGHLAESVVRLQVGSDRSLSAVDFFSPSNNATLDLNDTDLGSGGPAALPDNFGTAKVPHLLFQEGKDGRIFLLNRDNLGGMGQGPKGTDAAVQTIGPLPGGLWGHPAVWGGDGGYVYQVGNQQPLIALQAGATADGTPTLTQAGTSADSFGFTSGSPIVTSTGTNSGSAVVWVVDAPSGTWGDGVTGVNATLNAYSAVPDAHGTLDKLFSAPIGRAAKYSVVATDSNRVYVGTRETDLVGKVIGFGKPAKTPLTTAPVTFGSVEVGPNSSAQKQVTLTATQNGVKVTGATVNASPFTVDTSPLASPVTLNTGDQLTLNVTFTPTAPGAANGIMTVATSAGNVGVSLNGTGLTNGLGAAPSPVKFQDDQPTGTQETMAVRIWNTGSVDETIQSVTLPSAPFTVQGLSQNTVIGVGKSVSATITFAPTAAGPASDRLTVVSTSGTLNVPLTGGAVSGFGHLQMTPSTLDFGNVPVGSSATVGFDATNTGTAPLTISKAKAPLGVFSTTLQISEGQVLGPGQSIHVNMKFTPTAAGLQQAKYEITPADGQGALYVPMSGNGVAPSSPASTGNPTVTRPSGGDRFGTGVAVSQSHWANAGGDATGRPTAHVVVLARGDQFADALAGVPLAAKAGGPLLLTDPASLTPATLAEIRRVLGTGGGQIDVLGGTQAIAPGIVSQLTHLGYSVNRFAGADRDHTALDIAQRGLGSPQHVVLATGQDYADALAAGPFATGPAATAAGPAAVMLTDGKTLAPDVRAFIASRIAQSSAGAPAAWAIGGQAVTATAGLPGYVRPLAGATRYDTDIKVVQAAMAAGDVHQIGVATGTGFPDALTGGALTAATGGELVLVPSTLPPETANLLSALRPQLASVDLFGGTAVISPALAGQVTSAVNGRAQ
ncbi:cell wall-binding repeat-containing protein [Catenulispora rubra]|uniref:cell wall-binding repeat-containing protein n=1 Tax=Catenulispora rubra TaxID=280293 RepID=UPI001892792B|nr:cell wall-binding repeat-containing protein [Catenulispora rubra]